MAKDDKAANQTAEQGPAVSRERQEHDRARLASLFPKLDGLTDSQLIARCHLLEISSACGREGMLAGIRKAGSALVDKYVPGGTICPDCAGKIRVASSPRGPVRYHCRCPACGASVKTEKLLRPLDNIRRRPAHARG